MKNRRIVIREEKTRQREDQEVGQEKTLQRVKSPLLTKNNNQKIDEN